MHTEDIEIGGTYIGHIMRRSFFGGIHRRRYYYYFPFALLFSTAVNIVACSCSVTLSFCAAAFVRNNCNHSVVSMMARFIIDTQQTGDLTPADGKEH